MKPSQTRFVLVALALSTSVFAQLPPENRFVSSQEDQAKGVYKDAQKLKEGKDLTILDSVGCYWFVTEGVPGQVVLVRAETNRGRPICSK